VFGLKRKEVKRRWKTLFIEEFHEFCFLPDILKMKMALFWFAMPCSLVEVYRLFGGVCCLHRQGDQTTRRNNSDDCHLHTRRRENL
jgi:hypothetical protein